MDTQNDRLKKVTPLNIAILLSMLDFRRVSLTTFHEFRSQITKKYTGL